MLPIPPYYVALYVASLSREGYAPSTIKLALSAISWYHRMNSVSDPTSTPLIQRMLIGAKHSAPPPKKLLPITRPILHDMVTKVDSLALSDYLKRLMKALLLLSYHTCARVGELLVSNNDDHTLKLENTFFKKDSNTTTLRFVFSSFKHNREGTDFLLESADDPRFCPVRHLIHYLQLRGTDKGYLFISTSGAPIRRDFFACQIQSLAVLLGLNKDKYNTHSLRIGRTSDMADEGESEATIRRTGRWNSNAYLGYVRCVSFVLPK